MLAIMGCDNLEASLARGRIECYLCRLVDAAILALCAYDHPEHGIRLVLLLRCVRDTHLADRRLNAVLEFRKRIEEAELNPMQRAMVKLRLDLLDAYLRPGSTELKSYFGAGQIVLVDLTDPFLDGMRFF